MAGFGSGLGTALGGMIGGPLGAIAGGLIGSLFGGGPDAHVRAEVRMVNNWGETGNLPQLIAFYNDFPYHPNLPRQTAAQWIQQLTGSLQYGGRIGLQPPPAPPAPAGYIPFTLASGQPAGVPFMI